MSTLERLQEWYLSQCNGDWEHSCGVTIESLDNPGWRVRIDLESTPLDGRTFQSVAIGSEEENHDANGAAIGPWMMCEVADHQ